ncbi:MAG: MazF family transcriptional regulator, partial [Dehalococcoidia bacterium]
PALVLAEAGRGDFILCQITSNPYADPIAVELTDRDFSEGSLRRVSYVRPGKLFTAHQSILRDRVGVLHNPTHARVIEVIVGLLRSQASEP